MNCQAAAWKMRSQQFLPATVGIDLAQRVLRCIESNQSAALADECLHFGRGKEATGTGKKIRAAVTSGWNVTLYIQIRAVALRALLMSRHEMLLCCLMLVARVR